MSPSSASPGSGPLQRLAELRDSLRARSRTQRELMLFALLTLFGLFAAVFNHQRQFGIRLGFVKNPECQLDPMQRLLAQLGELAFHGKQHPDGGRIHGARIQQWLRHRSF